MSAAEQIQESIEMPLEINKEHLNDYSNAYNIDFLDECPSKNCLMELGKMFLDSKQYNEPYEDLLAKVLNLNLNKIIKIDLIIIIFYYTNVRTS